MVRRLINACEELLSPLGYSQLQLISGRAFLANNTFGVSPREPLFATYERASATYDQTADRLGFTRLNKNAWTRPLRPLTGSS